jgi:hypothetical protein
LYEAVKSDTGAASAAKTNEGAARAPNTAVVISDLRIFKTPLSKNFLKNNVTKLLLYSHNDISNYCANSFIILKSMS